MKPSASTQGLAERRRVVVRDGAAADPEADVVTVEEPLEIRIDDEPVAVVMRTPGNDFDLVAGFLLTEAILPEPAALGTLSYCPSASPPNERNVVDVRLAEGVPFDGAGIKRNFYATSSCGVCGKASIDQVRLQARRELADFEVAGDTLHALPDRLRTAQDQFERTGSLHAAGLFDPAGELLALREDVGRHNAVDKLVGHHVAAGRWPPSASILMVSGRTSFEIVQKARLAGIGFIASVSGPSSLAVDLALEAGITLTGFVRGRGFNVYANPGRLRL